MLLVVWTCMSSCNRFVHQCEHFEKKLHIQLADAERITNEFCRVLQNNDFDSLWHYSHIHDQVLLYVYINQRLVYWSDSWLSESSRPLPYTNQWHYGLWNNAHGVYRYTKCGSYEVLTVVPVKYNYSVTSEKLTNAWIVGNLDASFRIIGSRSHAKKGEYLVKSNDGKNLFLITSDINHTSKNTEPLEERFLDNFSYQSILASDKYTVSDTRRRLNVYYGITLLLACVFFGITLYRLIRYRGVRNMPLSSRLQLVLISTLMIVLALIYTVSILHMRSVFISEQRHRLQETASHIQTSLQNLYFWDMGLSSANSTSLNIDLRDMSFDYETDIHVYDLNGQLLGSSTPRLFDLGLLSRQMSSAAFFSDDATKVQYERLGRVEYLSAYTEFVNGNYSTIGYIAVPSFISQNEMDLYIGNFVARLLPLYIILLVVCLAVVWVVARMVSHPLSALSEQMKNYHLGDAGFHVSYRYHDELGELIRHYNEMLDALAESTQRLARSERESAWRTMARQVAHEINNSLTPMKLTLQQLQRSKGSERFENAFDRSTSLLIEQIDNMSNIASSFSSFAKMPEVEVHQVDIAEKMHNYITLLRNQSSIIPIRYIGPAQGVMAMADSNQIIQVFTNIVRNAVQAMEGREDSDIIIIMKDVPPHQNESKGLTNNNHWVEISFSDNGPGIPKDVQDKVFVPNFTTKNTGAGLGLAISRNIVEGCGGKITFKTSEKGTIFFVYLKKK